MVARGGLARVRPLTWLAPLLHRGRSMPEEFLADFGRQSPSTGRQGCGRRPLTSEMHVPRLPAPRGALGGIRSLLEGSDGTPARLGPKTFPMELRTVLNRVHRLAGFVYGDCRVAATSTATATWKSTCFHSGRREPGYDRFGTRHFQFVPVLGLPTLLVCTMHSGACPRCGTPEVEKLP